MFPNVRLLIAAVVASVVALSCGFALFATFRVNHEPLSRLATGAAPLQLAAGNPIPSAAPPASADPFGNRFPLNQAGIASASTEARPSQPEHDDSVEPPSTSTAATAPDTNAAEPEHPAPEQPAVAQAAEPKQDEAAVTPSELPSTSEPLPASEPPPAPSDTAAAEPPAEQASPAEQAAPTEQANQETNPETKPDTATTAAAEPPPPAVHHKPAHRHRLAAKPQQARQARAPAPVQFGRQPAGIGGPFVPLTGH
jgi:hypothetical protein